MPSQVEARVQFLCMGLKYGTQRAWTRPGAGGGHGKYNELQHQDQLLHHCAATTPAGDAGAAQAEAVHPAGWLAAALRAPWPEGPQTKNGVLNTTHPSTSSYAGEGRRHERRQGVVQLCWAPLNRCTLLRFRSASSAIGIVGVLRRP
jgi:hypothetical protein